jgi:hypothetical protein
MKNALPPVGFLGEGVVAVPVNKKEPPNQEALLRVFSGATVARFSLVGPPKRHPLLAAKELANDDKDQG